MKKQPKQIKMESTQNSPDLSLELQEAKNQSQQFQAVAQEAVNRLVYIEKRFSPHLLRKPTILNILFHWKELIATVEEMVKLIKEFKELIEKPKNDLIK